MDKAIRLIEYLTRLASLRAKILRDVGEYERLLWLHDIPKEKGCFTQAWGPSEEYDSDIWIEIIKSTEPDFPALPNICSDWTNGDTIRRVEDIPELYKTITKQDINPSWKEGSDKPQYINQTLQLEEYPEVQKSWDDYLERNWLPWAEEYDKWKKVHKIYSDLFAIYQEQLRLGEEYELVLGIGLLTWQPPDGQRVRRHLIATNALLEFEARLGKFTVRPNPDGASLRPELDMLDIGQQPPRAADTAKASLAIADDDPWEKNCIEGVLKALVHSINPHGEYNGNLEPKNVRAMDKPIVEYAPALILRKRSSKGLTETLKHIKERIEAGEQIPKEFAGLAEIQSSAIDNSDCTLDPGKSSNDFGGEIFFPKPSNEEQRGIVNNLRAASGVLVQGPPGTGKSHTIANLVCHLLATGQRTLITAKTPRALQVLKDLVPEELRPLCINLLGSGLDEKRSLESSVGGILRKNVGWNEVQATAELAKLEKNLHQLREEKARVDRRLRDMRESETHSQIIGQGRYRGTAAQIAQAVNRDGETFDWFMDTVTPDQACPISDNDMGKLLDSLRRFTPEKRVELNLPLPTVLLMPEKFTELVAIEKKSIEKEAQLALGTESNIATDLSEINDAAFKSILDTSIAFQIKRRHLSTSPHSWIGGVIRDVIGENAAFWSELCSITKSTIASIESKISLADCTSMDIPDNLTDQALFADICVLKKSKRPVNYPYLKWGRWHGF